MKNTITSLSAIAITAMLATAAQADTKVTSHGRAGYKIVHFDSTQTMRSDRVETRVALVMEKPDQGPKYRPVGRAGYRVVPASNRGR